MNNLVILGYGKYKGWPVESIPSDYLEKLIETTENKNLIRAIDDELDFRELDDELLKIKMIY